jgi:hypothetical protein
MAGRVKLVIDTIIETRARGNEIIINTTRAKLMLKGINIDRFTPISPDTPDEIAKIEGIAADLGVSLT